ncbi:hypothetical protein [Amycolatopsis speibonae]|uniref:WYL domain-containing protein n=1 Tax=Amycolatopsis speibonae TaxID=1450224 RepID=A0ABV7NYB5_9PSEU
MSKNYTMALISALVTAVLGIIGDQVLKLDSANTFLVLATGTVVSVALGLIEHRLKSDQRALRTAITSEMGEKLALFRMLDSIDDEDLRSEILTLARRLSAGEVPSHIAAIRTPVLYERAKRSIYASNVGLTRARLYRWDQLARFRRIVEVSARRSKEGVELTRTFFLSRQEFLTSDGHWDERCYRILSAQADAGIEVRIVWVEDLELDNLPPHRKLVRDLTIFDGSEAVDTTGVQVIYRYPSERLRDFLDIQKEQLKYSDSFDFYKGVKLANEADFATPKG